jgi:hypothetical protein
MVPITNGEMNRRWMGEFRGIRKREKLSGRAGENAIGKQDRAGSLRMPGIYSRSLFNRRSGRDRESEPGEHGARKEKVERLAIKSATAVQKPGMPRGTENYLIDFD